MASLDTSTFEPALRILYAGQKLQKLTYEDRPLLAMLAKMETFGGRNLPLPVQLSNPAGRSGSFAKAQAGKSGSKFREFILTRSKDYAVFSVDNETIDASKGDANAFVSAIENEVDSAFDAISDTLSLDLYRKGSGVRGRISSAQTVSANTITLQDAEDVVNFELDMKLVVSSANGGGSVRSGAAYVVGVDRDAGTVTVSSTMGGSATALNTCISGVQASDYIFVDGDYDSKIKGLDAWLPDTAPTAGDSFFGVDRSVDATRLAGVRFDASSFVIEEGLQKALARMSREGANPDTIFLNHQKYQDLNLALQSKVQYVDMTIANIAFRGIQINGPKRPVKVMSDKHCPFSRGYALTTEDWKFYSLGRAPKILTGDGNKVLRESDADAMEGRIGYYGQIGCRAPGRSGVILL